VRLIGISFAVIGPTVTVVMVPSVLLMPGDKPAGPGSGNLAG
jgi:hypothetical protein